MGSKVTGTDEGAAGADLICDDSDCKEFRDQRSEWAESSSHHFRIRERSKIKVGRVGGVLTTLEFTAKIKKKRNGHFRVQVQGSNGAEMVIFEFE